MQSVPTTEGDEPHGPASDTEDAPATRAPIRKRSLPAWLKSPTPTKVYIEAIEVAFAEPSTPWEEARVPRCALCCKISTWLLVVIFTYIIIFTLLKVPYMPGFDYYTNQTYIASDCTDPANHVACYGPQGQLNMMAWNDRFRGVQLVADYPLFVGPHTVMALGLEVLFCTFFVRGWSSAHELSKYILPLAAIFAFHVIPVAHGLPGLGTNLAMVFLIFLGCIIARWGRQTLRRAEEDEKRLGNKMLFLGLAIIIVAVNTAPFAEIAVLAGATANATTGEIFAPAWVQKHESKPLEDSGEGVYAGCKCPAFGWFLTFTMLGCCIFQVLTAAYRRSTAGRAAYVSAIEASTTGAVTDAVTKACKVTKGKIERTFNRFRCYRWTRFVCEFRIRFLVARLKRGSALMGLWRGFEHKHAEQEIYPKDGFMTGRIRPELYLEAYFEIFILNMILSWTLTLMYNPDIVKSNRLKDIVGYSNMCVGFDTEPARTFAAPGFVLMSYFGIRFVSVESKISAIRNRDQRKSFRVVAKLSKFKSVVIFFFGILCLLLPVLLIVTPTSNLQSQPTRDDLLIHFGIFVVFILVSWFMVLARFIEAEIVSRPSKIWFGMFSFMTWAVLILGRVSVGAYDYDKCPSLDRGDPLVRVESTGWQPWPDRIGDADCVQTPPVPPGLLGFFDFGWFFLLACTTGFLPTSASIRYEYKLVHTKTTLQLNKFKAAAKLQVKKTRESTRKKVVAKVIASRGEVTESPSSAARHFDVAVDMAPI